MSFDIKGNRFAAVTLDLVQGRRCAGFYRLEFFVGLITQAWEGFGPDEVVLTTLTGRLTMERQGAGMIEVGTIRPESEPLHLSNGYPNSEPRVQLIVDLAPGCMEAIEDFRAGGDLELIIYLRGHVFVRGTPHYVSETLRDRVHQGTWVAILNQMKYGRTLLLEVPLPEPSSAGATAKASTLLQDAHKALLDGRWRDVVGKCREVIEAVEERLGDAAKAPSTDKTEWDKHQRILAIARSVKNLGHLAHHGDDVCAAQDFTREDARAVISVTAALLRVM